MVATVTDDINKLNEASSMEAVFSRLNDNTNLLLQDIKKLSESKKSSDDISNIGRDSEPIILKQKERAGVFQRKKNFNIVRVINKEESDNINDEQEERKKNETRGNITLLLLNQIKKNTQGLLELGSNNQTLLERQSDIAEKALDISERQSDVARGKLKQKSSDEKSGGLGALLGGLSGSIVSGFSSLGTFAGKLFNGKFFTDIFEAITKRISKVKIFVKAGLKKVFSLVAIADMILNGIRGLFDSESVAKAFDKQASEITLSERISNALSSVLFDTVNFFTFGLFDGFIKDVKKQTTQYINNLILGAGELARKGIEKLFGADIANSIAGVFSNSGSFIEGLIDKIEVGFSSFIDNIANPIFDFFFDPKKGIFGNATQSLIDFIGKNNISSIFDVFKLDFSKITDFLSKFFDTSSIVKRVVDIIDKVGSTISDYVSNIFNKVVASFSERFDSLKSSISGLIDDFSFSGIIDMLANLGKFIFNLPAMLLKSGAKGISESVTALVGDNPISQLINKGLSALSNGLTVPSDIPSKENSDGFKSQVIDSKPVDSIRNNTQLSKQSFFEKNTVVKETIIKEPQILQQQAPQQTNPLVRRTESEDMKLSFINSGVADGI